MANTTTVKSTAYINGAKIVLRKTTHRDGVVVAYRVERVTTFESQRLFSGISLNSATFWYNQMVAKAMDGYWTE